MELNKINTMEDVEKVFQRQYDRQPTDEELQKLFSTSWSMIKENCFNIGVETICDILLLSDTNA